MTIRSVNMTALDGGIVATLERFGRFQLLSALITGGTGNKATFDFPFVARVMQLAFDNASCAAPMTQDATLSLKSSGGTELGDLDTASPVLLPFAQAQTFIWAASLGKPILTGCRFALTNFTSGRQVRLFAVLEE